MFYSHSKTLPDGTRKGIKSIQKHNQGVSQNALTSFESSVSFSELNTQQLALLINDICRYHDLGKYSKYFQTYLLTNERVDNYLKAHARFGAYTIFQKYKDQNSTLALLLYYIVVNHHLNLDNLATNEFSQKTEAKNNEGYFNKQKVTFNEYWDIIKTEIGDEKLEQYVTSPEGKITYRATKELTDTKTNIQNYFLINYLFSLLIEADKLDASDTSLYSKKSISKHLVDKYRPLSIEKLIENQDISLFSQNELRSYGRLRVNQFLERADWQEHKLFTLTAPTGLGKTLMALDFAIRLREKIRETEQRESQIIYALPFINIIEQSLKVYSEVLGENINLLAHYQYADALEQTSKDESSNYNQKMMMLDTWQCDVVITTFVQFLQTLIGNRNKLLKKFNHFAGSIIILDEVQTIRLGQLPLIGTVLFYLSKFLNTRIVLMTATKPKIYELANQEILNNEGEDAKSIELLPDYENVFRCFKRTKIVSLIDEKLEDEQQFIDTIFLEKWSEEKSCIIVCNTVKRSLDVFKLIVQECNEELNPVYYLSTNIIPARRQSIIDAIKADLEANLKPILVSTQCVEAGVDLDFDMGFRDLGPMDSIIQVAGRINRNNNLAKQYSPLYIIDFGDCEKIYDKVTQHQARLLLENNPQILEDNYLEVIESYFSNVAGNGNTSFFKSREIYKAMKALKYDSEDPKKDMAVSSFQVIEEQYPPISVFIEIDEKATEYKDKFIKMIHKELTQEEFSCYKKGFHQHIISVPSHLPKVKEELKQSGRYLLCEGIYIIPNDELEDFYNLTTGFIRTNEEKEHSRFF
ncbi:CRISPR-associated helicase Cas3' [Cellulophaga sp. BC115SP]|uniref:CRISPR-associated helicase Cas3' n=1 Tax=Cellulophaga sp. BC115SP TaxID=2683263 RepID=UPI001411F185|nr:CRISPR-associated helicase Cas3' [Cellulophaga sp. BC115SP]NBB31228.1 CRISPR-associated helicase Cas3' [Cellulophaga sp. BC115SP]